MSKPTDHDLIQALGEIVKSKSKATDWAKNYAMIASVMICNDMGERKIRHQLLYVISNITHWRGDVAEATRQTLKAYVRATS